MIQHLGKFDKQKNHPDLRAKIIALIAKHSRSPNNLYDACRRDTHLTRAEFRKFLDEMDSDGDISINANNRVVLPKPPQATKPSAAAKKEVHTSQPPEATDAVETRPNEIQIYCLVNRSRALKHPKQKKDLKSTYYAHKHYTPQQIPLEGVYEETLFRGYQVISGEFRQTAEIRTSENWKSQQLFFIEFDDTTEESLDAFIQERPFVVENAWLVTESLRSRYDDPDDATCNGQLRVRLLFCMPCTVNTPDEREWIYEALEKELPGCDDGSANSMTNGGLGRAGAAFVKIGKIVDTDWFNAAITTGRQKKAEEEKAKRERAEARKRQQAERAAMGFTEREGELPLDALAKSDPSLFLESLGLSLKSERGRYQHWGRSEKREDIALSINLSNHGNWQITVFANSIPIPPAAFAGKSMPFTRFYCYHELHTDIKGLHTDSHQWKDINAELARRGYGTWLSDEEFKTHRKAPDTPRKSQRRSMLRITEGLRETLVSLEENQQAILDAFGNAVTETDSEIPHYIILSFEMGSGKNHAFLTTLATLKKRGIGIFENHEQVDEQVANAFNLGLRAMGFRGRGYKFEESGLSALPVNMREMMTNLFDKYEVMCGFYDQIQVREDKGLGAFEYCLSCPFKKQCPYLAQFLSAAEMDFLALCMHDLFFDPSLAAFLQRLWRREEETEEEQLIGDMLGVQTETETGMEFDFGVVDEVVARTLYLSNDYTFADFEALATAWEGEALGDFFTEILKSLRQTTDDTDPLSAVKSYLRTLDDDTQQLINQQMTQLPKLVSVHAHTIRDKETDDILSEYYVADHADNEWVVPVSPDAEKILREREVPTLAYQTHLPHSKIGVSPYGRLRSGEITVSQIQGRIWSQGWTFLDQLLKAVKLDIQWIGTKYNAKGEPVCCDTLVLTIPPQVNPMVKRLVLMGGTPDVENIIAAFTGQPVKITVTEGKTAAYAPGVQTFQFTDARITHQSVFEYETDAEGKTIYDAETNAPKVIGIKPTALKDLQHTCTLAERHIAEGNLKPVFISYKDFTEPPIADLPIVQRMHNCLQVKHFDLTRGLNFEGVKVFLTYGYPKSARPDVVKQTAEILHHADPIPLDFTYQRVNETTDGYEAYQIGKYPDLRVEAVRQQLTRDKSKQALFRARPTRWENTITLNFSGEPIPGWTERATGFTRADFYRAERFEDIGTMIAERTALTAENSIEDFQRVYNCSYERARQLWIQVGGQEHKADTDTQLLQRILELKAENPKPSDSKIAEQLGISRGRLQYLLKKHGAA